jgi:hypothetical protein
LKRKKKTKTIAISVMRKDKRLGYNATLVTNGFISPAWVFPKITFHPTMSSITVQNAEIRRIILRLLTMMILIQTFLRLNECMMNFC